ncbi:MAG: UDP-3-O-[3-hydroxymyristoyl] N-acetylglucosamine deacetylase [Gemmatimonadetes bacterium]|nr:UDP-3-O-[3-hydroxymyristoyl] N-acetylglucosamine deacetylase [Gemmatimonadota bacterium]
MPSGGRRSIARPASLSGVGIHSGRTARVTLRPAAAGHGITFRRTDLPGSAEVSAIADNVTGQERRTTLGEGDGAISTVEHVLAAVSAHVIDDLAIEVEGPEPPIMDGSAAPYFRALENAGVVDVGGAPVRLGLLAPFVVREGEATYLVAPRAEGGLRLTVTIEWDHPAIGRQSCCYDISPDIFERELARARTFGWTSELEALRDRGLARGANRTNTIGLTASSVDGLLHWPDEFVRHKATDLLGDLVLLGGRLDADIVAFRPSHRGNLALVRAIQRTIGSRGPGIMGIDEIMKALPHRYPMLLVDRILEVQGTERIVGIKNVTINEPFFQGHFPGLPIMPGVLIVEAMAQVGGMLILSKIDKPETKGVYLASIDKVKFRRPVVPGDQIRFEVEMVQLRGKTCKMKGVALVDGQVAAEAEMMAMIVDR